MPALLAGGLAVLLAGAGSQILDIFSRSGPG
jgi:hypothetical protein